MYKVTPQKVPNTEDSDPGHGVLWIKENQEGVYIINEFTAEWTIRRGASEGPLQSLLLFPGHHEGSRIYSLLWCSASYIKKEVALAAETEPLGTLSLERFLIPYAYLWQWQKAKTGAHLRTGVSGQCPLPNELGGLCLNCVNNMVLHEWLLTSRNKGRGDFHKS